MFIQMKAHVTQCSMGLTDGFLIIFEQQWSSMGQRNVLYQALTTQIILVGENSSLLVFLMRKHRISPAALTCQNKIWALNSNNTFLEIFRWSPNGFQGDKSFNGPVLCTKDLFFGKARRQYEEHKGAKWGNEETKRKTDEGGKRKERGRVQWRDKQSIICGVTERSQGSAALTSYLKRSSFCLWSRKKHPNC